MERNLTLFQYEGKAVRTVIIDGEPWWIAKDVCAILKYANASDAIKTHCKGIASSYPLQTPGGVQETRIINEPDLYRLIVKSTLPEAEKFESWVFETVLPSIRKTGQFSFNVPTTYAEALRLAADQAEQIEELKPKAIQYDIFMNNESNQKIGDVAKTFGIKPNTLHKMLRDAKILQDNYVPYADYTQYFKTVETPTKGGFNVFTSFINPKGIDYITKRFNLQRSA
jgi:anti-repressor protein